MTPRPGTGIPLAFLCLAILGILPIICNSRPAGSNALDFAFALSCWQLLFICPLSLREYQSGNKGIFRHGIEQRKLRRIVLVNLGTGLMFGLATWCYVLSMERAGAVNAAIAIQAYPLFAILVEMLLLRRLKTLLELAVTVLLVTALYFLGTGGTWRLAGLTPWFLPALGVPLLWSVAHVLIREELTNSPITPIQVTFFRVLLSTIFLGGISLLAGGPDLSALFRGDFLLAAMLMGFFYDLELIAWFHAIRHIDVSLASSVTTPWPALTMILSVVVLGDSIETYQVTAFLVVAACIYLLLIANARKSKRQTASDG